METLDGETTWDQESGVRDQASEGRSQESASFQLRVSSIHARGASSSASRFPLPAVDPRVAYLITDILSDERRGVPAFGQGNMLEIGRPAAAKTGTTTDWRDNWTLGYTPDLTVGVWVGNADNTPMKGVSGISGAGPIWHDFMRTVLRERPPLAFTQPEGLVRVEVCADSGLLPMRSGGGGGEEGRRRWVPPLLLTSTPSPLSVPCPQRRYEWFIAGTEPTEVDRSHVEVAVDARSGRPARRVDAAGIRPAADDLGCCRRSTLRGRGRMRCRSWHRWGPRQETRGRGTWGARECAAVGARGRWARSERAGELSPLLLGSPSPPLSLTSPDPNRI